jgi:DNA mismatch endonuclease (patch repair protein)
MDSLTPSQRSKLMSRVPQRHSKPELAVRKLLTEAGYRYTLHARNLPGSPDIVFSRRKKVIFLHGCFWHRHPNCNKATMPKTRTEFWAEKFKANVRRDSKAISDLKRLGWKVMVVWECQIGSPKMLGSKLFRFLGTAPSQSRSHHEGRRAN